MLENAVIPWREAVLIEHWPTDKGVGSLIPEFAAVRTADWKYVEYATGEIELFELINDPFELENLAGSPDLASIQTDLARELARLTRD